MGRSEVYITQYDPRKNTLPAQDFGELVVVIEDPYANMMIESEHILCCIKEKMKSYSINDYILCIGDPAIIVATAMVAGKNTGGEVNLLKWDRQERKYYPVKISV